MGRLRVNIALLILVRYRDCHFEAGGRRQEAGRSAPHYSEKGHNLLYPLDPMLTQLKQLARLRW